MILLRRFITSASVAVQHSALPIGLICISSQLGCAPKEAGGPNADSLDEEVTSGGDGSGGTGSGGRGSGGVGSGGDSSGGAGSGGDSSGGASGEMDAGCRSVADCPPRAYSYFPGSMTVVDRCASPFTPSDSRIISGIPPTPGWCGRTDCLTLAPAPAYLGSTCESDDDCANSGEGNVATANLCREGTCVVCEQDADCGSSLPHCDDGSSGVLPEAPPMQTCVGCLADADCSGNTPVCVYVEAVGPRCVQCRSTADCTEGNCEGGACVPACSVDDDCLDPALICGANRRCEAHACTTETACPTNLECQSDTCVRKGCSMDQDCDGVCVNGACHETLGSCVYTTGLP